jgi:hypothetical protein
MLLISNQRMRCHKESCRRLSQTPTGQSLLSSSSNIVLRDDHCGTMFANVQTNMSSLRASGGGRVALWLFAPGTR